MEKIIPEKLNWAPKWGITRYASKEDAERDAEYTDERAQELFGCTQKTNIDGNILVNVGINEMWTLVAGTGGTLFDNTNAYLGVGDSNTAEAATQTDLQAVTNKVRVAMDTGYPTYGTSQQAVWRSTYGGSVANWHWYEFAIFNASTAGDMLNRKVSDQGTKTSGQTWQCTLTITLS